jgi:hypothetical protein
MMNMTMKATAIVGLYLFLFGFTTGRAQLSGTYTVNSSAAASATNYLTLTAAVADLTGGTRPDGSPGVYYYRALHQAADGKQLLTNVASVAYTPTGHLLILPNPAPAHSTIALRLSLPQAGQAQLRVYNALGQLQTQQHWATLPAGSHTLALPATLAAGVYVVEMVLDAQRLTQKLVVR